MQVMLAQASQTRLGIDLGRVEVLVVYDGAMEFSLLMGKMPLSSHEGQRREGTNGTRF